MSIVQNRKVMKFHKKTKRLETETYNTIVCRCLKQRSKERERANNMNLDSYPSKCV